MIEIEFISDHQKRLMYQTFKPGSSIHTKTDVDKWRALWMQELKAWHTPYKALIDLRQADIRLDQDDIEASLGRMHKFFSGLFLKDCAVIGPKEFPWPSITSEEEARQKLGIREGRSTLGDDLRALIQIDNHFKDHVVEVRFLQPVQFKTKADVMVWRSKLTNNLTQWHSGWHLLCDFAQAEFDPEMTYGPIQDMLRFFKGFFMKQAIGYGLRHEEGTQLFPIRLVRTRHKAMMLLSDELGLAGDEANCRTRKN